MTIRSRPRPQQLRAAATEEKILDAAATLFAQHGFEAVTTKQLAVASGVATGALYHHFAGKDELYQVVLQRVLARRAAVPDDLLDASRSARERLTGVIEWWVDNLVNDETFRLLLNRELLSPHSDEPQNLFHAVFSDAIGVFSAAVGDALPDADVNVAAATVFSLSYGLANFRGIYEIFPIPGAPVEGSRQIAEHVTQVLLHGLTPEA